MDFDNANFFYDQLTILDTFETFKERCSYLEEMINVGFPFYLEEQPEAWIQRLIEMHDALPEVIVSIIIRSFGCNRICKDISKLYDYPIRIPEAIGMYLNAIQDVEIEHRNIIEKNIITVIMLIKE